MFIRKISKLIILIMCVSLALLSTGCGKDSSASKTRTMNLAVQPSCAFLPIYVARANGWIEEEVKDMDVKVVWTDFTAGPPMNESFVAGQQDIGVIGDVPAVSAVARGQQNVWISTEFGGEHYALLVLKDSGISTSEDLRGKKIGVTIGSQGQNLVEKVLESGGISSEEVQLININQGDAQAVLTNKEVDAVALWEPNVTRLVQTGTVEILADGSEVNCNGENIIFARKEYLEENADLVKIYLEQYYRGVQAIQENPEECCKLVADYFGLEPELIQATLSKYNYSMQFADTDREALHDTVMFLISIGVLEQEIDVNDYIDDTLAREVLKQN